MIPLYDLKTFNSSLAPRPYCTDELMLGLKIRPIQQALQHKYVQANDNYIKFLIVDCDHDDFYMWEHAKLAPPNLIVRNRQNGHYHAIWALSQPIYKDYQNKAKNLAYFAKIQQAYTTLCQGDKHYINLITKNPNHQFWETVQINRFYAYSLDELADFVELPRTITKKHALGEGRNCWLFDTVRKWAYREVLFYKQNQATFSDFYNVLLNRLEKANYFENSPALNLNELRAIAKSICKFCWSKFSIERFSEIQKIRAHKQKSLQRKKKNIEELRNEFS